MRTAECKFLKGEESLSSRNMFHSASSGNRDLWSNARWIRQIAMKGSPSLSGNRLSWPALITAPSFADGLGTDKLVILILSHSHSSHRKPQKQAQGSDSRAVPSKKLLKFWLKRKVTEICGTPGALESVSPSLMAGICHLIKGCTHTQTHTVWQSN